MLNSGNLKIGEFKNVFAIFLNLMCYVRIQRGLLCRLWTIENKLRVEGYEDLGDKKCRGNEDD